MKNIITYGTFDDLHKGHINILKRASKLGELTVGLSADSFNRQKGKECINSWEERKKQLETLPYVKRVIAEESWEQKEKDIKKYNINILLMGNDWEGRFDFLSPLCEVIYLPRTKNISTTQNKQTYRASRFAGATKHILQKGFVAGAIGIFFILSYCTPKKKGLYIFGSINGKEFSGNSKAMYLYFKNKKNCKYISSAQDDEVISKNSLRSFWYILRSEYIFLDGGALGISFLYFLLGKFSIINLWHGEPLKKINFSSEIQKKGWGKIDTWFISNYYKKTLLITPTCSKFSQKNLQEAFITEKVFITGLPRNDILFQKPLSPYFKKESKNIILYAPTWRDTQYEMDIFSEKFLKKLDEHLKNTNSLFLIKGHINSHIKLPYSSQNIINISDKRIDVQEILQETDVLITDYSSIYIDFLLTNRPILFYAYDLDNYLSQDREMYIDYDKAIISPGLSQNETELLSHITNITDLQNNGAYKEEYKNIKNMFHTFSDGKSCERLEMILDSMK